MFSELCIRRADHLPLPQPKFLRKQKQKSPLTQLLPSSWGLLGVLVIIATTLLKMSEMLIYKLSDANPAFYLTKIIQLRSAFVPLIDIRQGRGTISINLTLAWLLKPLSDSKHTRKNRVVVNPAFFYSPKSQPVGYSYFM